MNSKQSRRLAMLGRVIGFRKRRATDFPEGSKGAELLDLVAKAEADATVSSTEQVSGGGETRSGSATKEELYDSLLEDLRAISATAKPIAKTFPNVNEKFRLPRSISQISIITTARAFLKDAQPLADEFVKYELSPSFLTDLAADILAYERAEDVQGDGLGKRVGATRTIVKAIADGYEAVKDVDPLIKNKYKHAPAVLAEWRTASRVERAPRKAKEVPPVA
jgi:hypothetical protein